MTTNMSRPCKGLASAENENLGTPPSLAAICATFDHARPAAEVISELSSSRDSFGLALLLLDVMKKKRVCLPLPVLNLSDFSLSAGKLRLLLSFLSSEWGTLEILKCGPEVCRGALLSVLINFLQHLKEKAGVGETGAICLKTLDLSGCDLFDSDASRIFLSLPRTLESPLSFPSLGSLLEFRWLPSLLSLDLSGIPLGPSGIAALSKGLAGGTLWSAGSLHSSGTQAATLPLKVLKLSNTEAKAKGVETLAEALKAKQLVSLEVLDLGSNRIYPQGLMHLAAAIGAEAVPILRVLILKDNRLTDIELSFEEIEQSMFDEEEEEEEVERDFSALARKNYVGSHAAQIVAAGRFPKLRILDLANTGIVSFDLEEMSKCLGDGGVPFLEELDVSEIYDEENASSKGISAFSDAIESGHLSRLNALKLCRPDDMVDEGFPKVSRILACGKLLSLRSLELHSNKENVEEGVIHLAEGIESGRLPMLESLSLSLGYFSEVGGSALAALGRALGGGGVPLLKKLRLKWSEQEDEGVAGLAEGLGRAPLSHLVHVSLELICGGAGGGDGCRALGETLSRGDFPCLRQVDLDMGCDSFGSLCEGLSVAGRRMGVVLDVKLHRQKVTREGYEPLMGFVAALRDGRLAGLRRLCLDGRDILNAATVHAIGQALGDSAARLSSLEELEMGEFQGDEGVAGFFKGMAASAGQFPFLKSIVLKGGGRWNRSGTRRLSAVALSALLTSRKVLNLKTLEVDGCRFGQTGVQALAAALCSPIASSLRRLQVLFAKGSELSIGIGSADADDDLVPSAARVAALMGGFSVCLASPFLSNLQELRISELEGLDTVRVLCTGLGSGRLSSLRDLNLSGVLFEVEGGRALSEVVDADTLPSLRVLNLFHTMIEDEGVEALSDAWLQRPPPPLEDLYLGFCGITETGARVLAALIGSRRVPHLSKINLRLNPVGSRTQSLLFAAHPEVFLFL
uniref:Uncharacterized protein n=1 Tax=Chromera velia CCMP2878 TaxID=1169474 RepID=A0A0G4FQ61_9ALVE|eukprot:Cvel_18220.t1-p1 / transcript=Cvel_18220.t1 / gene=Cvel_18220 / organism=Chromera_velia_CCMP2878 / gene_product=hypothetical protein / transcript_product=hypothetical protein / location=Cvel_scaffold1497:8176-13159(+) / protein_length=969 / sequence_SO=supercontig / SO=protein_coding / is_pseudo=false